MIMFNTDNLENIKYKELLIFRCDNCDCVYKKTKMQYMDGIKKNKSKKTYCTRNCFLKYKKKIIKICNVKIV